MRDQLLSLYELQRIDGEALELERSAEVIPQRIQTIEAELDVLRTELGELNTKVDQKKSESKEFEAQAQEESEKHQKWKRRLNEIKSPREYQALSREIEMGERQVRNFEESALDLMGEIEEKQKVIAHKAGILKEREADVSAQTQTLKTKQKEVHEGADKIREGRIALVEKIPKNLIRKYDQISARRNGLAVATVTGGTCSGCHVNLRPQMVVELLRFQSIDQCPSCNRVLVHVELLKASGEAENA